MASLKIDESVFEKLAEVLKKHNLSEIEYKYGEAKIRISAINNNVPSSFQFQQPIAVPQHEIQSISDSTEAPIQEKAEPKETDFSKHSGAVKSPMVGTCYLSSEPGAPNFVVVGDSVQEGQPLLIIEAMKVMNLIKAPKAGKIIHIAVANSDPIEFGQLLVVIE